MKRSPFKTVHDVSALQPIELIELALNVLPFYIWRIIKKLLSIGNHKLAANVHCRNFDFNGDYVMVHVCLERYPENSFKKPHRWATCRFRIIHMLGCNMYLDMSKHHVFEALYTQEHI